MFLGKTPPRTARIRYARDYFLFFICYICYLFLLCKDPTLPRADGKGGILIERGILADGDQSVVGNIVPDGMGEGDGLTVIDG